MSRNVPQAFSLHKTFHLKLIHEPLILLSRDCDPSFYFLVFNFEKNRASFLVPGLSLRSGAGLEDVLDESCDVDVEDEFVPELDDNPGKTIGTTFSVLHRVFFPWSSVAFDRWPTQRFFRVLRRACPTTRLQACHQEFAPSRRDQDREPTLVLQH